MKGEEMPDIAEDDKTSHLWDLEKAVYQESEDPGSGLSCITHAIAV